MLVTLLFGCADTSGKLDSASNESAPTADVWGEGPWMSISAGGGVVCAIRGDGSAVCRGHDVAGATTIPDEGPWIQVATNGYTSCGLRAEGTLACWGGTGFGLRAPPEGTFDSVWMGDTVACALDVSGEPTCWGAETAARPPAGSGYQSLSLSLLNSCGITMAGALHCAGSLAGYLALPEGTWRSADAREPQWMCAVSTSGTLACSGHVDLADTEIPGAPPSGEGHTEVFSTLMQACALRTDGSVSCWPDGITGYLDRSDVRFSKLASGAGGLCGITSDTAGIVCWGNWGGDL